MKLIKAKNSIHCAKSSDAKVVWKNCAISAVLAIAAAILIFLGLTLTPISKVVIDGTSASYLIDGNIGYFLQYVKVLISGGYFLIVPMWITTTLLVFGIFFLYLAAFYYFKKDTNRPYRILFSKAYWSSFRLKVGE